MKKEIVIFIGFLMEMFCFTVAGFIVSSWILRDIILYFVFMTAGVIIAYFVGKMIRINAVEEYKRSKK